MSTLNGFPDSGIDVKKTSILKKIGVIASMIFVMGGTITGVITYTNVGFSQTFITNWLSSFLTTVVVMAPTGFLMMTLTTKLVKRLLPALSALKQNLVVGLLMALIMESVMAATTAANNIGFADWSVYFDAWFTGFLAALPVGLALMLVMSITVKPKLEKFLAS